MLWPITKWLLTRFAMRSFRIDSNDLHLLTNDRPSTPLLCMTADLPKNASDNRPNNDSQADEYCGETPGTVCSQLRSHLASPYCSSNRTWILKISHRHDIISHGHRLIIASNANSKTSWWWLRMMLVMVVVRKSWLVVTSAITVFIWFSKTLQIDVATSVCASLY